jgi:hypothetical protein
VHRHLGRCKLAANTVKAYKRQTAAYAAWLAGNADHADAFSDVVSTSVAVTWQRLSAGDWAAYAADVSRRPPQHSVPSRHETPGQP